jgi:sucrose-6F-phosphate phosphohydrolase
MIRNAKLILVATDLDNTLIGDNLALNKFNRYLSRHRQDHVLIYVTGRSYISAKKLMLEKGLIKPNYLITGVGTEIYDRECLDLDWAAKITLNWQREAIASFVSNKFPELKLQDLAEQNPWKISFHLLDLVLKDSDRSHSKHEIINRLNISLLQQQLNAQVIFSSNLDVDILPINANKGNAVTYIQQKLEISADKTLVCGDSGNDISMFQQAAFGVIVNNAQIELIEWYQNHSDRRHHFANNSYASGILEAFEKFSLLPTH